jgi:transcriptional regulator with XRE-family HTH domain
MTLAEYLASTGQTASALAAQTGCAVSTITRAARGEKLPSRALMESIFEKTSGAVTPNDFYGIAA